MDGVVAVSYTHLDVYKRQVYLVGNIAGNGWDAANAIPMTKVSTGVYEFVTTLSADTAFKIICCLLYTSRCV